MSRTSDAAIRRPSCIRLTKSGFAALMFSAVTLTAAPSATADNTNDVVDTVSGNDSDTDTSSITTTPLVDPTTTAEMVSDLNIEQNSIDGLLGEGATNAAQDFGPIVGPFVDDILIPVVKAGVDEGFEAIKDFA